MSEEIYKVIKDNYEYIFEDDLIKEMAKVGEYRKLSADQIIIEPGMPIKKMPLLLTGLIKIMREDEDGEEILLYYLEKGDTCAMTMTCCMGNKKSEVLAITEEETELVMVPVEYLKKWLCKYESWKAYIFDSYNLRLKEMLGAIDALAFMNMDKRVMKYLLDKVKFNEGNFVNKTHAEIAREMHTSRVVVSRIVKELERRGDIKLHRNKIEVLGV